MNLLTNTYTVKGGNFSLLIERLKRHGVNVLDVKNVGYRKIRITVPHKDRKKFFAICNNMWYNKLENETGVLYPLLYLKRSLGILIGLALFVLTTVYADGIVLGVDRVRDGDYFSNVISETLDEEGIKRFSRFSKIDLNSLAEKIYSSSELIAFCSCKKRGARIVIDVVKANESAKSIDVSNTTLTATVDGVIKSLTVLRGTPLLTVGTTVNIGDVIVDGYYTFKEEKYTTYVLATCVIESVYEYFYECKEPSENVKNQALAIAKCMLGQDTVGETVTECDGGVKVLLRYNTLIQCG